MFDRHSALAAQTARGRGGQTGQRGVRFSEIRGWHFAQLACFGGREAEFERAVRPLLHADLPPAVGRQSVCAHGKVFRITQNQYWIVSGDAQQLSQLALALPPAVGTATSLSHSRVRLAVEGPAARTLLAKGIAIDLHPAAFRVGDFAQTGLHHTGILLERSDEDRYELFLPRTFAVSIWDWLMDAALPLGYDVHLAEANT